MRGAIAVAVALLAAGCAGPSGDGGPAAVSDCSRPDREGAGEDWSNETLAITIAAGGTFRVDVPVPLSPGGSDLDDWLAEAQVPTGWAASKVTTDEGPALRIEGQGPGTVRACSIQPQSSRGNGCCAEQYLDARWSTSTGQRSDAIRVQVLAGTIGLAIDYTALSNWCGADARYEAAALGPGWHTVPGQHPAWCE